MAATLSLTSVFSLHAETLINAAGGTFPYPIYSRWFDDYHKKNPEVRVNYQSIGSGGGVRQFTAGTIDFGASDSPMEDRELSKVSGIVHHIPTVIGAVVPAFHLSGIDNLNFTGEVLAGIYLGEITQWNDPAIRKLNPNVALPKDSITVIRRADGSGTTYCFTDYLSTVSPDWKNRVGKGQSVNWPVGVGGKGNEGVAGLLRQSPNSIGYLELVYAKQSQISYGAVQNQSGRFVKADVENVTAAAEAVKMPDDFRVSIVNAPGEKSYPISTYTWILVREQNSGGTGPVLKKLFNWILSDGEPLAPSLDYAPLPTYVKDMVHKTVDKIQ